MTSLIMRTDPLFTRNGFSSEGRWNFPIIKKQALDLNNVELIACSDTHKGEQYNQHKGVHFFVDDYRFESIYRHPERTLDKYKQYRFILSPDYSLYADMPMWRQIESIGKSRWCGAWWQENGLSVVPTVSWGQYPTYAFCFDGIEIGSAVAIGMIGCKREKRNFLRGYDAMLNRIQPEAIICLGSPFEEMRGNLITVDYIASRRVVR